jgi:hypothetical protein
MRVWVILFLLWLPNCSSMSTRAARESVLADYIDAVNGNAVERALSHHTIDAEFLIPGQEPIVGTEEMRALLQWDSVLGSEIRFDPGRWRGDTLVLGEGAESNAWFRGIGIDSVLYAAGTRFVFEEDDIRGIYPSEIQPGSMNDFRSKYAIFFEWADTNAPEVSQLAPGGQFTYSGEAAERWLAVLARYGWQPEL